MRRCLLLALALLAAPSVAAQASSGVTAASSLNPGRVSSSTYGDVWGYTAPDGTEYGLMPARDGGLSIFDLTPAPELPPVEVAFVPTVAGAGDTKDVKVIGHHAYVVNEFGPMQIVDLSNPASPVQVGLLDTQPGTPNGGAHNVAVSGQRLYVTGGRTSGNAGLRIYSVAADPAAPVFVGSFRPDHFNVPYYHDFEVRGTVGYGPGIYSGNGIDVLDLSDPAAPTRIATFDYAGSGAHNTCLSADGGTLYVGDEIGSSGNWTRIFDVTDPTDVEFVGDIVVDNQAVVHNCYVRGDRLYIAHYTEGLQVYDVSAPAAPVRVAYYDTYAPSGYGYRGAWSVYPYFESGKVIVSDMQSGLFVFRLDGTVATAGAPAAASALALAPNPTAGTAAATFSLAAGGAARLAVLDALGREVAHVDAGALAAGPQRLDVPTDGLPAGVYRVVLSVDGQAAGTRLLTVAR